VAEHNNEFDLPKSGKERRLPFGEFVKRTGVVVVGAMVVVIPSAAVAGDRAGEQATPAIEAAGDDLERVATEKFAPIEKDVEEAVSIASDLKTAYDQDRDALLERMEAIDDFLAQSKEIKKDFDELKQALGLDENTVATAEPVSSEQKP